MVVPPDARILPAAEPSIGRDAAGERDGSDLRLGAWLGFGAFLLVVLSGRAQDLLPSPPRMALVLCWPVAVWLFERTRRAAIPLAYLVGGGLLLRLANFGAGGSDHLAATTEAIQTFLAGADPYRHFYVSTIPPGSPVSQPPFELWLHLPGELIGGLRGVMATETMAALVVLAVLAWLASRVSWTLGLPALGLYAALGNLVNLTNDGSNDTTTGALVLLAAVALVWAGRRGWSSRATDLAAIAGAVALGTKQTTLFLVVLLVVGLWRSAGVRAAAAYVATGLLVLVVASAPFILLGPVDFARGLLSFVGAHADVYGWNIWVFAGQVGWPILPVGPAGVVNILATVAALALALWLVPSWRPPTIARSLAAGIVVTLVLLLTARWTTYAYFAMLAPVVLALPVLAAWERQPSPRELGRAAPT